MRGSAANLHARRRLNLTGRLIIWNDTPTLSLSATDPVSGEVIWSGMAVWQPDAIASATIKKLSELKRRLGVGWLTLVQPGL